MFICELLPVSVELSSSVLCVFVYFHIKHTVLLSLYNLSLTVCVPAVESRHHEHRAEGHLQRNAGQPPGPPLLPQCGP